MSVGIKVYHSFDAIPLNWCELERDASWPLDYFTKIVIYDGSPTKGIKFKLKKFGLVLFNVKNFDTDEDKRLIVARDLLVLQ